MNIKNWAWCLAYGECTKVWSKDPQLLQRQWPPHTPLSVTHQDVTCNINVDVTAFCFYCISYIQASTWRNSGTLKLV